jgi:hypothetical protein
MIDANKIQETGLLEGQNSALGKGLGCGGLVQRLLGGDAAALRGSSRKKALALLALFRENGAGFTIGALGNHGQASQQTTLHYFDSPARRIVHSNGRIIMKSSCLSA